MRNWYKDGQAIDSISVDDRGLQYADGLFETIAVRNGKPRLWKLHSERLQSGSRRLDIQLPATDEILRSLMLAIDASGRKGQDALLKIIVTRGLGDRGYAPPQDPHTTIMIGLFDRKVGAAEHYQRGVAIRFCNARLASQPQTAGIKLLSRLDQVRARAEWSDSEILEGLMLDQQGSVVCGTMSNLFIVTDGLLQTPGISDCGVSGVMRQHLLAIASQNALPFETNTITPDNVRSADEIFLSNSQFGIWPVARCGSTRISDWPVTRRMRELLQGSGVIEGPE
jgi:4-amino-4-deoxychorismate lyase